MDGGSAQRWVVAVVVGRLVVGRTVKRGAEGVDGVSLETEPYVVDGGGDADVGVAEEFRDHDEFAAVFQGQGGGWSGIPEGCAESRSCLASVFLLTDLRASSASEGRPMEPDSCQALTGLMRWESSLDGLIEAANQCDRQEGPPVRLGRDAVVEVLQRCISGELDFFDLPKWADAIHMLDRIEIGEVDVEMVTQFIFEVSTPELFEPITVDVCRRWVSRMEHG
ncbi:MULTISPECIES: hypothetical protein [Streptomyces]|uniref:hypothetical protein n=1 Tax=Streptomyces TaxID=1883 RepID=UPI00224994C7|nr:hypothetical protein [Streptomyces sp. JHD 1]MCX2968320.1 hypothetical protein [Streptomyces sp. JHD 1]